MARTKIRDRGGARIHGAANETGYKYGLFFSRMLFTPLLPSMRRERRDHTGTGCIFQGKLRKNMSTACVKQLLGAESTVKEISR